MHNWFKNFREKYSYSIRKATKFAQSMPKNSLENIHEYLFKAIKENIERNIYLNPNIVANVDETSIVLEPITGITIEKKGKKQLPFIPLVNVKKEFLVFYIYSEMG